MSVTLLGGTRSLSSQQVAAPDTTRDTSRVTTLAPVKVSASMSPGARSDVGSGVPANISVIGRDQIASSKLSVVPEVMASEPSVSYHDDIGQRTKVTLSARGFSVGPTIGLPAGISVFLDGVRQNEPDEQEVNFDLLPLDQVARVEFLSGNGTLLGPNSLGGAINLITLDPPLKPSASIEATYGSWMGRSVDVVAGGPAGSGLLRINGGFETATGWRAATSVRRYNGMASAKFGDETRGLKMQALAVRSRGETAGSLPESLFKIDPRINFTPGDFDDLRLAQMALSAFDSIARGAGRLTTYLRASAGQRFNVNQAPDPNVRGVTRNFTGGATADWRRTITSHLGVTSFRFGADGAVSRVSVRIFDEPMDGSQRTLTTYVRSPTWDAAPYLVAELSRSFATLSAGARYDVVSVPFRDELRATEDRNYFRSFSPTAGLDFALGSDASLYFSAGRTFRAPAILELGCADADATCPLPFALGEDPPLRPVRATTYELGARRLTQNLVLNGSLYLSDLRDEIFFIESEASALSGFFQNLPRTRRLGGEVEVRGRLPGDIAAWYASYALTRAEFRSDAILFSARSDPALPQNNLSGPNHVRVGARLPMVPDDQVKFGVAVSPAHHLEARVDTRWVGKQWLRGDEANETKPLGSYFVTGASGSVAAGPWTFSVGASNLFDSRAPIFGTFNENRQTNQLERFLTPLTARTVHLSVSHAFGQEEK